MNVVLIGFMGSGKSSVAKLLAPRLNLRLVELDDLIVARSGRKSAVEIFELDGEARFRTLESEIVQEVSKFESCVISSGGGVVENSANLQAFSASNGLNNTLIVYLQTDFSVLKERLAHVEDRFLFKDIEKAAALYAKRQALYQQAAHVNVTTDLLTLESVTEAIAVEVHKYQLRHVGGLVLLDTIKDDRMLSLVIGDPVSASLSPQLHSAAYKALGIENDYQFLALKVSPERLAKTLAKLRSYPVRGISVTMPHKQAVMPLLDRIDPQAEEIGAVNTIVNDDGVLTGFNTDVDGVLTPLRKRLPLNNAKVALLGAGGAARAAAYGLIQQGAELFIINRSKEKAVELAQGLAGRAHVADVSAIPECQVVINATSVGMKGDQQLPCPATLLSSSHTVFDLVYNPLQTPLLKEARTRGASTIEGIEMFIEQGAAQFELYCEQQAPREVMRQCLLTNLQLTNEQSS